MSEGLRRPIPMFQVWPSWVWRQAERMRMAWRLTRRMELDGLVTDRWRIWRKEGDNEMASLTGLARGAIAK